MKNNKRAKLNPTLMAAVFLGLTAINSHAEASQGMKLTSLKTIVTDFEISQDAQNNREITFAGMLPKRCASGAKAIKGYDESSKSHYIIIRLAAECEKDNFVAKDDEERVPLSSVIKTIQLEDKSGTIAIRYLGDDAKSKPKQDELEDLTAIVSSKELKAAKEAEDAAAAEKAEDEKYEKFKESITEYCQNGDYVGLGNAIRDNEEMFKDVNAALKVYVDMQQKEFDKKLAKAKTADEARSVYGNYLVAAAKNRWDTDAINNKYVKARERILNSAVEALKESDEPDYASVASDLSDWKNELLELDLDNLREHKREIAAMYMDLGLIANEKGDLKNAEKYMLMASKMSNKSDSAAVKGEIARMNKEAYAACLEGMKDHPERMVRCEKQFVNKARKYDEQVVNYLSKDKSDEGQDKFQDAQQNMAQYYGSGPSVYYTNYGTYTPYNMGGEGSFQNLKNGYFQNYQQNMMMQQGVMNNGMMNNGMMSQQGMGGMNYGMPSYGMPNYMNYGMPR